VERWHTVTEKKPLDFGGNPVRVTLGLGGTESHPCHFLGNLCGIMVTRLWVLCWIEPPKLRPYGAIEMWLLLFFYF